MRVFVNLQCASNELSFHGVEYSSFCLLVALLIDLDNPFLVFFARHLHPLTLLTVSPPYVSTPVLIAIVIGAVLLVSVGTFFGYRRWRLQRATINVRRRTMSLSDKIMYALPTETELARIRSTPALDALAGGPTREARCDACHCVLVFPLHLAVPIDNPAGHLKLVARITCPYCMAELPSTVADAARPPRPSSPESVDTSIDGDGCIHVDTATHTPLRNFAAVGISASGDRGADVDAIDRTHARSAQMLAYDSSSHRAVAVNATVSSPAAPVRTAAGDEIHTPVVSPFHSRWQQFNTKR
jgi:hypothetical protein